MSLSLSEFIMKYNGKKVDYDKVFGPQCVDLFRQYSDEGLGIPEHTGSCSSSGGAKDLFLDYDRMPLEQKYFKRIKTKKFKQSDFIIWNSTPTNEFGHVAIFIADVDDKVMVFEQNGFEQSGAKIAIKSKENILGVLRKYDSKK